MRKRARVYISGRVQGVGFRAETTFRARRISLKGFVKNLKDGRVEAVFEGDEEEVDKIVNWCRKGTIFSKVNKVDIIEEEAKGDYEEFKTVY
ncbi:MAG: acylphosphatase [Candidatus Nealsonbacteria bacterium RIFOXYB1_FULL_40_15]|uniref:Acylphosphatase n=2 Tax=Candidatus Nealsoniibacteriota TaxID=1817911 RepID=A0A1G2ENW6_9BACT|nr:MAG: acylphosphatase [Candidatus Nealsonbacteria bacterium RIFOXYB1_FULL_40_15]OGZ27494.1 MAG: acylphosphatase [Candidatus Nealsonbacteria bacterium RIFOXYC1_FULL_40_7]OGZ28149.1 MAG: acylphosphatase [Candidatus Nealsonbacteria bacterium RIFOXYD1_FULL_39_11]